MVLELDLKDIELELLFDLELSVKLSAKLFVKLLKLTLNNKINNTICKRNKGPTLIGGNERC